jgi:hypothetical protein
VAIRSRTCSSIAEQDARDTIKAAGAEKITNFNVGGTSHVPIDQIVSHLPDDTDY